MVDKTHSTDVDAVGGTGNGTTESGTPDSSGGSTFRVESGGSAKGTGNRNRRQPVQRLRGQFWDAPASPEGEGKDAKVRTPRKKRLTRREKAEIAAQATIAKMEQFASRMLQEPAPMDEFERMLVEPNLASIFENMDTDQLEKFNWILTPGMLLFGLGLYGYSVLTRAAEKSPPNPKTAAAPVPMRVVGKQQPPPPAANGKPPSRPPQVPPVGENGVPPDQTSVFDQWANQIGFGGE